MKVAPSFDLDEFACHDGTPVPADLVANVERLALGVLQPLRDKWGPLIVVSGYRSPEHNARVGGAKASTHMTGEAADIRPAMFEHMSEFADDIEAMFAAGKLPLLGGLGRYRGWVHVDVRRLASGRLRRWTGQGVGSEPA